MKQVVFFFSFCCALVTGCTPQQKSKMNGVSFVASPDTLQQVQVDPILNVHANYAAIMPFGFIRNLEHPEIIHNTDRQWFGETARGAQQYIELLRKNQIKVMVKPQIWIWRGEFTGHLKMKSETDWQDLERSYRDFILTYVYLAQEQKTDLFCIGTELEQFIMERPQFWKQLIKEIRSIYSGKLTYAANWDEYKRFPFWGDLDYIGVDAYFPISEEKTPTLEAAKKGWIPWKLELEEVSMQFQKPILFTEYGYRSVDFAGKEPWQSSREMTQVNFEAQTHLLQALYDEVWNEDWFAGGFLWKWHTHHGKWDGVDDTQFSPQNKPAETTVKQYYQN
ncbi:MAG: glycoside hydrolase [Flavobacteriaceae bacterium]